MPRLSKKPISLRVGVESDIKQLYGLSEDEKPKGDQVNDLLEFVFTEFERFDGDLNVGAAVKARFIQFVERKRQDKMDKASKPKSKAAIRAANYRARKKQRTGVSLPPPPNPLPNPTILGGGLPPHHTDHLEHDEEDDEDDEDDNQDKQLQHMQLVGGHPHMSRLQ